MAVAFTLVKAARKVKNIFNSQNEENEKIGRNTMKGVKRRRLRIESLNHSFCWRKYKLVFYSRKQLDSSIMLI